MFKSVFSHIPVSLALIVFCCFAVPSFFLLRHLVFLCSHWRPMSSQCWVLVLACFIQGSLDNSKLSSSEHRALISYHTHFSSLAILYFYSFPVLWHSSSHVYILYFNWITNFQQVQDCLHVFESILVISANKAPKLIFITMI